MINDDVAEGLPTYRLSFDSTHFKYSYCITSKSTQLSFKKVDSTIENRLPKNLKLGNKIHSNQKGPITPILHSENQFLIIFIDIISRIAFIYFMTSMSEINESKTIGQEEEEYASFKTQVELVDNSHSYQ
jgi:hypothetical protein